MREYYSITDLAQEFHLTARTLRFYEDEGLLQPPAARANTAATLVFLRQIDDLPAPGRLFTIQILA